MTLLRAQYCWCALLMLVCQSATASVDSFDDIDFWVGSGSNRAALAIDWDGDNLDPGATSLVWGYRWSGVASGEQMLRAVLTADTRLVAKLSESGEFGVGVYGVGYDADDDGYFALEDGTWFDADGVATGSPVDGILPLDPGDWYAEGWEFGYWHYGAASGQTPTGWVSSSIGPSNRVLTDGVWDSYAFSPSFSNTAFADARVAAIGPPLPGDYNADGSVDAADYTVWRDTLGDSESYNLWFNHYGTGAPPASTSVPEPTQTLSSLLIIVHIARERWRRTN